MGEFTNSFQLIHDLQSALEVHREKTSPIGCLADQLTWSKMIVIQNLGFKYKNIITVILMFDDFIEL